MRAKSAISRRPLNIDYEIQHQTQKSKILDQDRKNFLRQAEQIKEKNKEEIEKLKTENKKLKQIRDQYINSKKNKGQLSRTAYGTNSMKELNNTDGFGNTITSTMDENYLRRLLDKEKHKTKLKKNTLFTLQDKLKQVESNKLRFIEQSPLMRNIRILQNRLDKVMIKYNQAQSIQSTYQTVVKRLKQERVGYDSQLAEIEMSLKGKQHDFEQLLLLAHDATHAKQSAYGELKRFEQRRVTVQEMRHKYIYDKKQQINKDGQQQTTGMQLFDKDPSAKVIYNTNPNPKSSQNYASSYKNDQNYQKQQLSDYQDAFRRLKEVTGVIDANQIIQKFKTQGLTTSSLEQLRQSYKKKIQGLKQEKQRLKKQLQKEKFTNPKTGNERKRLDQIQSSTATLTNQLQRIRIKQQRLSNQLINVKAGIVHLHQQTSFYKKENESSSTLEDTLKTINQKLRRMYDVVRNDPNYAKISYKSNITAIKNKLTEDADNKNFNWDENPSSDEEGRE